MPQRVLQRQPSSRLAAGPYPEPGPIRPSAPARRRLTAGLAPAKLRKPICVADSAPATPQRSGSVAAPPEPMTIPSR